MKVKKKWIVSLIAAIVSILLIAVVAVVAVSAAANQNIKSNVKVDFKPSPQVIGYVEADYFYGKTSYAMTTDGGEPHKDNRAVWFAYKEKPTAKTLQLQTKTLKDGYLQLSSSVKEIVFAFNFINTGYSDFTAEFVVEDNIKTNNMVLSYSYDNSTWFSEAPKVFVPAPNLISFSSQKCYIKVSIENMAKDADFNGDFIWNLVADEG